MAEIPSQISYSNLVAHTFPGIFLAIGIFMVVDSTIFVTIHTYLKFYIERLQDYIILSNAPLIRSIRDILYTIYIFFPK